MVKYIYSTRQEAEDALLLVNNYFGLPCGDDCLSWTQVEQEFDYYFLQADRLEEVLGNE